VNFQGRDVLASREANDQLECSVEPPGESR
jgi:hypothetical protein